MRLIDADALWLDIANRSACLHDCCPRTKGKNGVLSLIDEAPIIEAEPVRHGRWEMHGDDDDLSCCYFCSQCGYNMDESEYLDNFSHFKYCPRCGAKMDLKEGVVESG